MADHDDETTLSDDLAAAMDEVELDEEVEAEIKAEEAPTGETQESVSDEGEPEYIEEPQTELPGDAPAVAIEPEAAKSAAPLDWTPELKEQWAGIPESVQEQISSREAAINQTLQDTAQMRSEYDQFSQMIQPFIPLMSAEGAPNPMVAIKGLMETTAQLQMGNPQQKAQKIAQLIQHYGIDIGTLDNLLAGEPGQDPQTSRFEQMLDQRMAPVNQLLNQVNQANANQRQQAQNTAGQDIHSFAQDPAHPHFDQVKLVMADFMDMASKHGQQMTLQEAYDRACSSNPVIAAQVATARATQAQQAAQPALDAKLAAAGSVTGGRASGGQAMSEDMSLRQTIEAQFEEGGRI